MESCPFCRGEIEPSLERLGGPCPHCFNEIPGEESVTDPGSEIRRNEAANEERIEKSRTLTNVFLAVLVLTLIGSAAGWYGWQRQLESQAIDDFLSLEFDEHTVLTMEELEAMEAEFLRLEEEANDAELKEQLEEQRKRLESQRRKVEELADFGNRWDEEALVEEDKEGPKTAPDIGVSDLKFDIDLDIGPGIGPDITREQGALKGNAQTQKLLEQYVSKKDGDLRRCHEIALNTSPGTGGRWVLNLRLMADGSVSKVRFEAQGGNSNQSFESCVENKVKRWKLMETDTPTDFTKSYTFSASF